MNGSARIVPAGIDIDGYQLDLYIFISADCIVSMKRIV